MTQPLVRLVDIGKRFGTGTVALAGLNLEIGRHQFVSLLGPSGCGKSTALRLIAGLATPSAGNIEWEGEATDGAAAANIGFVFQEPTLMPWASVRDNVSLPLRLRHRDAGEARVQVDEALAMVGLGGFERAYPRELSGGMKMRVSIARALVTRPQLLLMDEPFAALDEITRIRLNNDLLELWRTHSWTVVFVTHSVYESVYLSNTMLGLNSADHNLLDLFKLYGASRWQVLRYLRIPSALPYFLGGLRIAGGLSLIGAVVAEFTAGTAGRGSGLAYRILETGYRLNMPLMFAALALITLTGVMIFVLFTLLSHLMLHKWHESAVKRES